MSFIIFTPAKAAKAANLATVTLRKHYAIGFNRQAVKETNLNAHKYVCLQYDPDTNRIGFDFTNDPQAIGAKPLAQISGSFHVSAAAFLKTYGLKPLQRERYQLVWDADDHLFCCNLNEPL